MLAGLDTVFVAVRRPLDELERRERARGDRELGTARYQHNIVHAHGEHDVAVGASHMSAEQCAEAIAAYARLARPASVLNRLLVPHAGGYPDGDTVADAGPAV